MSAIADASAAGWPVVVANSFIDAIDIDYQRIPGSFAHFRAGPFSLERAYNLGDRVDAWFVDTARIPLTAVEHERLRRVYAVGVVAVDGRTRPDLWRSATRRPLLQPLVDWCDLISEVPPLARFLMGPRRPTPTMIMLGCALALGFDRVLVLDGRLRTSATGRPFIEGLRDWADERTRSHDEWRSHMALDLAFLEEAVRCFPDAEVTDATSVWSLRQFLPRSPVLAQGDRFAPAPKTPTGGRLFSEVEVGGEIRRCAYVTACDSAEYLWGVRALANSLARHSAVPLIVVAPESLDLSNVRFQADNVALVPMPSIANPLIGDRHQQRFRNTYSKLAVFGLSFLDRAVYLDADTLVLRNIDYLFEGEGFAAAPDFGLRLVTDIFNTGVFAYDPNAETLQEMLDAVPSTESYDGGDQGFLNEFITAVNWLPRHANTLRRIERRYPELYSSGDPSVLHFVGEKPWELGSDPEWNRLDDLWFSHLSDREKTDFVLWIKERASASHASSSSKDSQTIRDRAVLAAREGDLRRARRLVASIDALDPEFFRFHPRPRWASRWGRGVPGQAITLARRLGLISSHWQETELQSQRGT